MFDKDAEKSALGAMLLTYGKCLEESRLVEDDFLFERERKIFREIKAIFEAGDPVEVMAISAKLPDEAIYLHELMSFTPTAANFGYYESMIIERRLRDKIRSVATSLNAESLGDGSLDALIDNASKQIAEVADFRLGSPVEFTTDLWMDAVNALDEKPNYLPSTWGLLNEVIGGFRPGALYIFGARPAVGKTIVGVNLAYQLSRLGAVAYFSLEMGKGEIMNRLFSHVCQVPMNRIESRSLTDGDYLKINASRNDILRPMAISDRSGINLTNVRAFCRAVDRKQPLKAIVIDYLQLMSDTEKGRSRYEAITAISNGLKVLARDLNVPVIALAQLNREVEGKERRPILSDLRDSGSIEQDADVVILLNREKASDDIHAEERNMMVLNVAKNRHGRTGAVALRFDGLFATVKENQ